MTGPILALSWVFAPVLREVNDGRPFRPRAEKPSHVSRGLVRSPGTRKPTEAGPAGGARPTPNLVRRRPIQSGPLVHKGRFRMKKTLGAVILVSALLTAASAPVGAKKAADSS